MQHISTGDYFLRLNGDEIVECEYPETLYDDLQQQIQRTGNLPLYQITEYPDGLYKKYYYQPKLLRKSPKLKLTSRHVVFTNNFTPPYEVTGPRGRGQFTSRSESAAYANQNQAHEGASVH